MSDIRDPLHLAGCGEIDLLHNLVLRKLERSLHPLGLQKSRKIDSMNGIQRPRLTIEPGLFGQQDLGAGGGERCFARVLFLALHMCLQKLSLDVLHTKKMTLIILIQQKKIAVMPHLDVVLLAPLECFHPVLGQRRQQFLGRLLVLLGGCERAETQ